MEQVEHIGIAVRSLAEAIPLFQLLLGSDCYKTERVESEDVDTAFFRTGTTKIELLEALRPESPLGKFMEKRGEGMHHIAFAVKDIRARMRELKAAGFVLLHEEPRQGADNKWVCFLHPRSTHGVLVELCEERTS